MRGFEFLKSCRFHAGALAAILALPAAARAGSIDLGTYQFDEAPGQQVQVYIGGGDALPAATLSIYTGDGSHDVGAKIGAPEISAVDLFANGSIFSNTYSGEAEDQSFSASLAAAAAQALQASAADQGGSIALGSATMPGLLATPIDTTDFQPRKSAPMLNNPISASVFTKSTGFASAVNGGWIGSSALAVPRVEDVTSGTSSIPEPASLGLLGLALPALLMRRRQRQVPA